MTLTQLQTSAFYLGIVTGALLLIFLTSWLIEPRRLINGIFFTFFFLSFLLELAFLIFSTGNQIFIVVMGTIFIVLMVVLTLILAFSWVLLLWNAVIVWRRESHTLSNMLTLFLALFLIGLWVWNAIQPTQYLPDWFNILLTILPFLIFYLGVCSFNFVVNVLLYQFVPYRYRADYLVVLGAGLIDGDQVSRLLGNRIDRAMAFGRKQIAKGRKAPVMIFSGGQGPDEKLPEAHAMAKYAIDHGWDPSLIRLEDQSTSTLENMAFSKKIIQEAHLKRKARVKFFTNNYHTFRASLFARMAGLKANGIGAKTRLYFLPNALIREFVAVLVMNKKRHMITIGLVLLLVFLVMLISIAFVG